MSKGPEVFVSFSTYTLLQTLMMDFSECDAVTLLSANFFAPGCILPRLVPLFAQGLGSLIVVINISSL